jgi:2',3'-cyclic-nucleotide 2'-phosphodiesterase
MGDAIATPVGRREKRETLAADLLPAAPGRPGPGIIRVLMVGDVIGKPGRLAMEELLPGLRDGRGVDLVIANGENLAGGMGLTLGTAGALFDTGVDVITSGNHIWDKREIIPELDREPRILRPLNYGQQGVPGRGWGIFHAADGSEVAVVNAQGRTYMQPIENPFTTLDVLLDEGADELPPVRLVDFHCELTSEKTAFGLHLDGRVSVVAGTHTHVATADERVLPRGTAYVSDLGMTGPIDSVIGFAPESVLPRFLTGLPTRFEVGSGPVIFNALLVDVDGVSGRAVTVERIRRLVGG